MESMTKKAISGLSALVLMFSLATPAASQVSGGGGLILAVSGDVSDVFELGLQGGVYVGLPDVLPGLRVGGDIEYYFPHSQSAFGVTARLNLLAISGNAHYVFVTQPGFEVYGLGGLTWTRGSGSINGGFGGFLDDDDFLNGDSESHTDLGLNLGAGIEFLPLDFGRIYAELNLVTGDYDRIVIGGGVRLGL